VPPKLDIEQVKAILSTSAIVASWQILPALQNFPHHLHDEASDVAASPLTGDPVQDLSHILMHISTMLMELS
jgi:phage terminase large subunit-like protein